jgi:hypothetical protein
VPLYLNNFIWDKIVNFQTLSLHVAFALLNRLHKSWCVGGNPKSLQRKQTSAFFCATKSWRHLSFNVLLMHQKGKSWRAIYAIHLEQFCGALLAKFAQVFFIQRLYFHH